MQIFTTADEIISPSDRFFTSCLLQFVFAAAAATIVSGSVAERVQITAYFFYSVLITGKLNARVIRPVCNNGLFLACQSLPREDQGQRHNKREQGMGDSCDRIYRPFLIASFLLGNTLATPWLERLELVSYHQDQHSKCKATALCL